MKVEVGEDYTMVLKEVFNPIIMRMEENNKLALCIRGNIIEMGVFGTKRHFRVDEIEFKEMRLCAIKD